jgi:uncharacterized RDD family membrane protein YckC
MSQEHNLYQPPAADVAVVDDRSLTTDASKLKRFGTFAIDYACIMASSFVLGAAIAIIFGERGVAALKSIPEFLTGLIVFVGYYLLFEGLWARTPGKFMLGTVVVMDDGKTPSFGRIVQRTLCRFIPFEPFSFFGPRGWHDSISKTKVVLTKP